MPVPAEQTTLILALAIAAPVAAVPLTVNVAGVAVVGVDEPLSDPPPQATSAIGMRTATISLV